MPVPVKNFLTDEQVKKLQDALRENPLPHVRERILIILLQNDGKTHREIARFLGCSPRTVAYWCRHGDPDNLASLSNKREQEYYRKATPEYIKLLLETIEKDPEEFGYGFGRWTGERLATYLGEETGIELSTSQVRRILKRKKYSYIWAKYSLEDKQNAAHRTEFKERLLKYLEIARERPKHLQIWFWDESGFSLRVIRRKNWSKKGKRRQLTGQRRRGRVNVMGGIRESDKKRVCFFINKGNADTFYEQLQRFDKWLKDEWASQGNVREEFQKNGPKILIVLDNASYHKRLDIREKIEREMPNISLEFLPAYSPDFNIIELVWHSCKEYIAHRLFQSVEELRELLERLLNQGELIIKWQRKIKNKGNSYVAT
jgi:transposase